jgi:hypothetical protein
MDVNFTCIYSHQYENASTLLMSVKLDGFAVGYDVVKFDRWVLKFRRNPLSPSS